jgi:hypothetical protein
VAQLRTAFLQTAAVAEQINGFRLDRIIDIANDRPPLPLTKEPRLALHVIPVGALAGDAQVDVTTLQRNPTLHRPWSPTGWDCRMTFEGILLHGPIAQEGAGFYAHFYRNGILEAVNTAILETRQVEGKRLIPHVAYEGSVMEYLPRCLKDVHALRALMIEIGTGKRRIDDTEGDYTALRSQVGARLRQCGIADPNIFVSLWDWYSYWKDNGLTSYQSRREYVNSFYKPVVNALEKATAEIAQQPGSTPAGFSARLGYATDRSEVPIAVREEAPEELRRTIVDIAESTGWDCDDLFGLASRIGKRSWEPSEPLISGKSSRVLLQGLMSRWPWYLVYDFIEAIFRAIPTRAPEAGLFVSWPRSSRFQLRCRGRIKSGSDKLASDPHIERTCAAADA